MPHHKPTTSAPAEEVADDSQGQGSTSAPPPEPVNVLYCGVCTWPVEYCEFGSHLTRCKAWLLENHPDVYPKYYSEDALTAKVGTLSLEAQNKLEKDTAKKEAKAEAKAEADEKKKQVIIKRIERTKRKHVTTIFGLETFGVDLKKASKLLAQRFATGASVAKNPQGLEEITVQGDVSDDILEIIEDANQGKGSSALVGCFKVVPADNVELVEDKKKKAAE
ncbi:density-regulated protein DRP1 [Clavulina sp. PMI_390]|nr:density-regulated protein DRP1 [Clavulina sp. PMI_390]